jgi:hypothetical protein
MMKALARRAAAVSALILPAAGLVLATGLPQASAYPADQNGQVYSYTEHLYGTVRTTNGGYTWDFTGSGGGGSYFPDQCGQVYSYTTGLYAQVSSIDSGLQWTYPAAAFCD